MMKEVVVILHLGREQATACLIDHKQKNLVQSLRKAPDFFNCYLINLSFATLYRFVRPPVLNRLRTAAIHLLRAVRLSVDLQIA